MSAPQASGLESALLLSLSNLGTGCRAVLAGGCGAFEGARGEEPGAPKVTSEGRRSQKTTCPFVFLHLPIPAITYFSLSLLIFAVVIRKAL